MYTVFSLVWNILILVSGWKLYEKFGEPGWKSLVPFYNLYVEYLHTWETKFAFANIVLQIVGTLFVDSENGALAFIGGVAALAAFVIGCIAYNKLAKSFGHGMGYTLGLIFLTPIFTIILGLNSDKYIGK